MPEYPQLNRGMGKLDPDLWRRMMNALRDFEFYSNSMSLKVRDRERRGSRSTPANSNLVRVFNEGENDIKMFESCVVTDKVTLMTDALEACEGECEGDACDFGECGVWPGGGEGAREYLDIYNLFKTRTAPVMVVTDGPSAATVKPKPGALLDVLVASGDILAGEYGWCYMTGMHYAFVWDPRGICNSGGTLTGENGDFYRHEFLYADLPDMGYTDSGDGVGDCDNYTIKNTRVCSNYVMTENAYGGGVIDFCYDSRYGASYLGRDADDVEQYCNLPLVIRPQGRYKVHWIDMTSETYLGDADGGGEGETEKMTVARWITNPVNGNPIDGADAVNPMFKWPRVRYAMDGGTYGSPETTYFHHWRLGNFGRGVNWPEWHNCSCTVDSTFDGPCDECLGQITEDFNEYAGGVHISALDSCFGQHQWTVVAAAGFSCNTTTYGKMAFVDMTMGIDENGNQLPSFSWQSGVEREC